MKKPPLNGLLAVVDCAVLANLWTPSAEACGGFFCTTVSVDQNAERIMSAQNEDSNVSDYVQEVFTSDEVELHGFVVAGSEVPDAQIVTASPAWQSRFRSENHCRMEHPLDMVPLILYVAALTGHVLI